MFHVHTYRIFRDGLTHKKHLHPVDLWLLGVLVKVGAAVCFLLTLGFLGFAIGTHVIDEDPVLTGTYGVIACGFLAMGIRLRSINRKKTMPANPVVAAPAATKQTQPPQTVMVGERRPQDFRRDQDNRPRPRCQACNSKRRDDGSCKNPNCVTHRQPVAGR